MIEVGVGVIVFLSIVRSTGKRPIPRLWKTAVEDNSSLFRCEDEYRDHSVIFPPRTVADNNGSGSCRSLALCGLCAAPKPALLTFLWVDFMIVRGVVGRGRRG